MKAWVVALIGWGLAACASTAPEKTESADADWVIHPNGTADRATVTLKLPPGFSLLQGAVRFEIHVGATKVDPGVPVVMNPSPQSINAYFWVGGQWYATEWLGDVTPQAGFDTEITFGVVKTHTKNLAQAWWDKGWLDNDETAHPEMALGAAMTDAVMRGGADDHLMYRPQNSANPRLSWDWSDYDMPFPAGRATLAIEHYTSQQASHQTTSTKTVDVTVRLGQRTDVEIAADPFPALATAGIEQLDARTMPTLFGEAYTASCQSDRPNTAGIYPAATTGSFDEAHRIRIAVGPRSHSCNLFVSGLVKPFPFVASAGSAFTVTLHRIEVDDVELTDVSPPKKVKGEFSVTIDGTPLPAGSTRFPTGYGVVVPAGHTYGVTVFYKNAAGVEKQTSYTQQL